MAYFGLVHLSFVTAIILCGILAYLAVKLFRMDQSTLLSFVIICAFQNAYILPAKIITSSCSAGGPLYGEKQCPDAEGYISYIIPLFNIVFWLLGPIVISFDKLTALNVRRKAFVIKKFYASFDDFFNAADYHACSQIESPDSPSLHSPPEPPPRQSSPPKSVPASDPTPVLSVPFPTSGHDSTHAIESGLRAIPAPAPAPAPPSSAPLSNPVPTQGSAAVTTSTRSQPPNLEAGSRVSPAVSVPSDPLEDLELLAYCAKLKANSTTLKILNERYQQLQDALGLAKMIELEAPLANSKGVFKMDCSFVLYQIINPPIIGSLLGVICGFIPGFKEWFFAKNTTVTMFVDTFKQIGNMAVPMIVFVLGAKLGSALQSSGGAHVAKLQLIVFLVLKLVIAPIIGIAFMYLVLQFAESTLKDNKVLFYGMYLMWITPSALMQLSCFLLVGYYVRECVYFLFWANILSMGTITISLFIMLLIFY